MSGKYTERIKTGIERWKALVLIMLFILAINSTSHILRQLENQLIAGYISIFIIIVILILTFKIINRYITEYEFIFTQNRLKAIKKVGKRSVKEVLDIGYKQIEYIIPRKDLKENKNKLNKKILIKYNFTLIGIKREKLMVFYREGKDLNRFMFQPSKKTIEILKSKIDGDKFIL